jgi:hypothetical protein
MKQNIKSKFVKNFLVKALILILFILFFGCESQEKSELAFGNFENKTVSYSNLQTNDQDGNYEIINQCSFREADFFLIVKNASLIKRFYHCETESDYTENVFRYKFQVDQFLVGFHEYKENDIVLNDLSEDQLYIENKENMFLVGVYETQRGEYFITNKIKIIYSNAASDSISSMSTLPPDMRSLSTVLGQTLTDRGQVCGNAPYHYHNTSTNIEDAIYESDRFPLVPCN